MIIPFIVGALYCSTPGLDNRTTTWNEQDQRAILDAQKAGCQQKDPSNPCLYKFIKIDDNSYEAVCGPKQEREDRE